MTDQPRTYIVYLEDNGNYQDDNPTQIGTFENEQEALALCKKIVDDFLQEQHLPGMAGEELFELYTLYGPDPWAAGLDFSGMDYAKERSREITS